MEIWQWYRREKVSQNISVFSFDDTQENAELYSLLGNLYDTKGEVLFANYLYQRSALLGYPEGEGKLGWSYFCGYGLTVDDLNDNDIDISIHKGTSRNYGVC